MSDSQRQKIEVTDAAVTPQVLSPCHGAKIDVGLGDGVLIGTCSQCNANLTRVNPQTGAAEWLDGKSPWTDEPLRPMEELAQS